MEKCLLKSIAPAKIVDFFKRRGELLRLHTYLRYSLAPWDVEKLPTDKEVHLDEWEDCRQGELSNHIDERFCEDCRQIIQDYYTKYLGRPESVRLDLLEDAIFYRKPGDYAIFGDASPAVNIAWNEFCKEAACNE